MKKELKNVFFGKTVLITGNSGFKGSWLTMWLKEMGAKVIGYSLPPETQPNLFEIAELEKEITHITGDIRDLGTLSQVIDTHKPQVIFHLAAQAIVLNCFQNPIDAFMTNAMGTTNLLEACRKREFIQAIVVITTDKCYDNKEWDFGYRENDPLGGNDPYSASKAMAEIATACYRSSFFSNGTPIATARAGNVIGGGDFSPFRLVPDSMKALLNNEPIRLRNPHSTRPWMHVLDPLHGYLVLAKKLIEGGQKYAEAWNFGPSERGGITTRAMVEKIIETWGRGNWIDMSESKHYPEMKMLQLSSEKAANRLGWLPLYQWQESLKATVDWFKAFEEYTKNPKQNNMQEFCIGQIRSFLKNLSFGFLSPDIQ